MEALIEAFETDRQSWQPSREEFLHTPCYCEENVHQLCAVLRERVPQEDLYVVFISNANKKVPLWRQRAGQPPDGFIVWDYHVILAERRPRSSFIWDLDSTLPFPCPLQRYERDALQDGYSDVQLPPVLRRRYKVVACKQFMETFASDRSHMVDSAGCWAAQPPDYPCITSSGQATMNLHIYLDMGRPAPLNEAVLQVPTEPFGVVLEERDFVLFLSAMR